MKTIKLLSLVAVAAIMPLFLTNCGPAETVDPGPTLEFIGGSEYISGDVSLPVGTDFKVGLNASHTKKIESLAISVSINGGPDLTPTSCTLCDTAVDASSLRVDYNGTTGNTEGTERWSFTVTDGDGKSTTKSITITVTAAGDPLFDYEMDNGNPPAPHRVYNFHGPKPGAHEIGGGSVTSAEPNSIKDIQDSTTTNEISNWPARWTSRNGASFKKSTGYSWATMLNTIALQDAWDNGGTEQTVISPVKGDYYVIKKPNGNMAFIEIMDVVSTNNNNEDYIEFRYKFRP